MNRLYLEYHDAEQNKRRFYQLFIIQGFILSVLPVKKDAEVNDGKDYQISK